MYPIHPAIIERDHRQRKERKDREERESRRIPLYAPLPALEQPDPAPERGVSEIDYTC